MLIVANIGLQPFITRKLFGTLMEEFPKFLQNQLRMGDIYDILFEDE